MTTIHSPKATSFNSIQQYLEDDFLPALKSHEDGSAAATTTTPLRQKRVGTADLTKPQPPEQEEAATAMMDGWLDEMSSTLLKLHSSAAESPVLDSEKTGLVLLQLLHESMEGVLSLTSTRENILRALQTLLCFTNNLVESSSILARAVRPSSSFHEHHELIRIELALTVCKVLRHLEKIPFLRDVTEEKEMRRYTGCFCGALQYLSKVLLFLKSLSTATSASPPTQPHSLVAVGAEQKLMETLYGFMEDYQVVDSIIAQLRDDGRFVHVTTTTAATGGSSEVMADAFASVLDFFRLLATSGSPDMLTFLLAEEIVTIFNRVLRSGNKSAKARNNQQQAGDHNNNNSPDEVIRGYQPTEFRGGWAEDPHHQNCIRVYELLAVSLRAVDAYSGGNALRDEKMKKRYYDGVLYCLQCNQQAVRECLSHVSQAASIMDGAGRNNSIAGHTGTRGFTLQVLREATAILAVLTELCDRGHVDLFCQKYGSLFVKLKSDARDVLLSTSTFLGASGMARELFHVMSDLEQGDAGGSLLPGNGAGGAPHQQLGISPFVDVLLTSRNNTRHEAIQFSHFVSGCSAAVSVAEVNHQQEYPAPWAPPPAARNTGTSGAGPSLFVHQPAVELTEKNLEQTSRCAMTNQLAFALEMEAGKCMFQAATVVLVTHPATNSFVSFTPEQMAHIQDNISWIEVRDVVAYRVDGAVQPYAAFGEVVHVDTVNLCCYVRPMGDQQENNGGDESVMVPSYRLLGFEERTKRQPTFTFATAAETSSELHRSRAQLSLGHLILAMRWCHEYAFEEAQQKKTESPWIGMNAQVLTLLLTKEIALHRRNRTQVKPDVAGVLKGQLLDLFGSDDEYASFWMGQSAAPTAVRAQGRLGDLLAPKLWEAARRELGGELHEALNTYKALQEETQKQQLRYHHHQYHHYSHPSNSLLVEPNR